MLFRDIEIYCDIEIYKYVFKEIVCLKLNTLKKKNKRVIIFV